MNGDAAKANLHGYLKHEREAVLAKLDGLCEYDVRRPLTVTGTNLLGLVKHLATWEARYLGEVFDRPFPEPLPRWDIEAERLADMWRGERATCLSTPPRVAWRTPTAVHILVHLPETSRHAGHADILREELDGAVGTDAEGMAVKSHDVDFWRGRREQIEAAARSAG